MERFKALVLAEEDGRIEVGIRQVQQAELPGGDVLVRVAYSSLNYKDGLAVTGAGKVIRSFPMVPGIDLAGMVVESASPEFRSGDQVLLTGWGVGERHWGGYAQMARVRADWLTRLPHGLGLKESMAIGTAGLTAMLCVMALERHGLTRGAPPVLVTGAAGGVGSIAVAILANLGYAVTASTGREEAKAYLRGLGAREIIDRGELLGPSSKPLDLQRWGGAVDTVGGEVLASVLRSLVYGGSVAACGNAGGVALPTTVLPFILRGVNLLGIDSVICPPEVRQEAWDRLARELPSGALEQMVQTVSLGQIPQMAEAILQGRVRGRVVVDVNAEEGEG